MERERERQRETERDRERQRETDRQTETETDRQTDTEKHRETEREADSSTNTYRYMHTNTRTHIFYPHTYPADRARSPLPTFKRSGYLHLLPRHDVIVLTLLPLQPPGQHNLPPPNLVDLNHVVLPGPAGR